MHPGFDWKVWLLLLLVIIIIGGFLLYSVQDTAPAPQPPCLSCQQTLPPRS